MGVRDFIGIIRELSFDQLKAEATLAPRLLVLASDVDTAYRWRDALFGPDANQYVDARDSDDPPEDPLRYDLIVSVGPLDPGLVRGWRKLFDRVGEPLRHIQVEPQDLISEESREAIRRRIADEADDRALAIGRHMPAMRAACAQEIVADTARVNGQFALVSNIPAVVPVIGNLVAVGTDFLVLTKNQLMMIFKLAAVFDRDLSDRWRVYSEMLPVVGAGLVWRTIAREVAALLPLAIGTVPKVAIAYAGTYAVGRAAVTYYERGTKLSREQMRSLYAEAVELLSRNPISLPRPTREGPGANGRREGREPES